MELALHPDAAKNFNDQAQILVQELALEPEKNIQRNFLHADTVIEDLGGVISPYIGNYLDDDGNVIAKFFESDNNRLVLIGEDYKSLVRIAEGMQKNKTLRDRVSVSLLIELIFHWL